MTSIKQRAKNFISNWAGFSQLVMVAFSDFKEASDIITAQQEIIEMQTKSLKTLEVPKELLKGLHGGWPCIACGQDIGKIDKHVKEALEKTKQLFGE